MTYGYNEGLFLLSSYVVLELRLWVGYLHLCSFNQCFYWIFFNSIKEINRLRKEADRILSKRMSDIYLKATIEKMTFSKLRFSIF